MPKRKHIKVEMFTCPGAGTDAPDVGFEVIESDTDQAKVGDFLLDYDVTSLKTAGCRVEVEEETLNEFL